MTKWLTIITLLLAIIASGTAKIEPKPEAKGIGRPAYHEAASGIGEAAYHVPESGIGEAAYHEP